MYCIPICSLQRLSLRVYSYYVASDGLSINTARRRRRRSISKSTLRIKPNQKRRRNQIVRDCGKKTLWNPIKYLSITGSTAVDVECMRIAESQETVQSLHFKV